MYGYVSVNTSELKMREFDEYNARYCGLCDSLRKNFGRAGQLTIQHDMTFLIYLLNGLYEPHESTFSGRCIVHPMKKRNFRRTDITDYAADMNVLLAWYKLVDDWEDDRSKKARIMMLALKKGASEVKEKYPEKSAKIGAAFTHLRSLEKESSSDVDTVSGCFGKVMAHVCDIYGDEWSGLLRKTGFYLGKFIYIMDAYEDMREDEKNNSYNPLIPKKNLFLSDEDFEVYVYTILNNIMAECAKYFEKLPVKRDLQILRNIIYAGVWRRWEEMHTPTDDNGNTEAKGIK